MRVLKEEQLIKAAKNGNFKRVKELAKNGADILTDDNLALRGV